MENTAAKPVRIGEWISGGWKMFTSQWKGWVAMSLGLFGAVMVPMMIFFVFVYGTLVATQSASRSAEEVGLFLIFASFFLLMLVMLPLSALLTGGMHKAALKQLRGGKVEFKDLFSARDKLLSVLGGSLLYTLLVSLGSLLCIIPAFIIAGLLFFTFPLIIDRNLGVVDAMKTSVEMTKPNLVMFTLFAFVVQLIASAGTYACYIGLLATLPLLFTITASAYRDCFGVEGAALLPPAEPWSGASYSPPKPETTALGTAWSAPQTPPLPTPPPPAAPPATAAPAVCPKCQAALPASAKFCFRCGTPAPGK